MVFADIPPAQSLYRLLRMRLALLALLMGGAIAVQQWLYLPLPLMPIAMVVCVHQLIAIGSWLRLRSWSKPVTEQELCLQLGLDVFALSAVLYFTGGWTNPFVSLYLVPIAVAASTLAVRFALCIVAECVLAYTALTQFYVPLQDHHAEGVSSFSLHTTGMWLTFVLSAGLIAYFVFQMAATLRERAIKLAQAREDNLRHEQIIGLATLAAGAAHELSTPLSTVGILAQELRDSVMPEQQAELDVIAEQIAACKRILSRLTATAGELRAESGSIKPIAEALQEMIDCWQLVRPTARLSWRMEGTLPSPSVLFDTTLAQALMNLLNNAADVSPDSVELVAAWNEHSLTVTIIDQGPGLSSEVIASLGQTFVSTKSSGGMGVGWFLTNATIERLGGRVTVENQSSGGAMICVKLPITPLTAETEPT